MATNPFLHCPDYDRAKDDKYITCHNYTADEDPCDFLKHLHHAKGFRQLSLAVVPFVLSSLTLLFNILFIFLTFIVVIRRGKSSRKRYSFLLSRAISTLLTQVLIYVMLIIWKGGGLDYYTTAFLLFLAGISVFTHTGNYLEMTWLLYAAVMYPLWYKTTIEMKTCIVVISITWVISALLSIGLSIVVATMFYPETASIHCDYATCQFPVFFCFVIIISISYFSVILFYGFLCARIYQKQGGQDEGDKMAELTQSRNISTMKRLSFSLLVFSVWKVPLMLVGITSLVFLDELSLLGYTPKSPCKTFMNAQIYIKAELFGSIALWLWLAGLGMDPLVNILSDPPLFDYVRRKVNRLAYWARRKAGAADPERRRRFSLHDTSSGEF